jgi:hypothetical protein
VPVIGLVTRELAENTADAVEVAVHADCRMIDTAVDDGGQKGIGEGLARCGGRRPGVAVERDPAELGLDHGDLTLIHPTARAMHAGAGRSRRSRLTYV